MSKSDASSVSLKNADRYLKLSVKKVYSYVIRTTMSVASSTFSILRNADWKGNEKVLPGIYSFKVGTYLWKIRPNYNVVT